MTGNIARALPHGHSHNAFEMCKGFINKEQIIKIHSKDRNGKPSPRKNVTVFFLFVSTP